MKIIKILLFAFAALIFSSCGESGSVSESAAGRITIKTDPEGALVFRHGDQQQGQTPRTFGPVPAGIYIFRIEKEGYMPRWEKVEVRKNKTAVLDVRLEPIRASVLVTSNPAGCMVALDGKELGPAPYIISNLEMGTYEVSVSRENFVTETKKLIVPLEANMPDSPFELSFNMTSDTGSLKITTVPEGAELYLDGERMASETPAVLNHIAEGKHKIKIEKKGYAVIEDTVSVVRNQETVPADYVLKPLPGSFKLSVSPADALVEWNGERLNEPEKIRSCQPGSYQLKVSKSGYDTEERTIKITADELREEKVILSRNTGEVRFSINPPGVSINIDGKLIGMSQPNPNNQKEAQVFRILGVSTGKHVLTFTHPYSDRSLTRKFTIDAKGETKDLMRLELWVPNADIEVLSTKRIYRNGMVIPTSEDSDEVIYMESPNVRDTYKKNEVRITYLERPVVTNEKFKTSQADLLEYLPEKDEEPGNATATIRILDLPRGSEVFVNEKSYGQAKDNGTFSITVPAGTCKLKISHKYGINTKNPESNTVEYKKPFELINGETKELKAPPILWVAECNLYLKTGKIYKHCRIKDDNGTDKNLVVETAPGKTENVKRSAVARKEMLQD